MFDILHRVGIKATPDKVYTALATPPGLAGWWTVDTSGADKPGGMLNFRFSADGREIGAFDMKILELHPDTSVVWQVVRGPEEWVGTKIRFDLRQENGFTIVLFRHEGWKEPVEMMYHCNTKWATFLLSLKSLVETGQGQPAPQDLRIGDWH
jgi:uncharacterized protein YndB with AHSA1/START domain